MSPGNKDKLGAYWKEVHAKKWCCEISIQIEDNNMEWTISVWKAHNDYWLGHLHHHSWCTRHLYNLHSRKHHYSPGIIRKLCRRLCPECIFCWLSILEGFFFEKVQCYLIQKWDLNFVHHQSLSSRDLQLNRWALRKLKHQCMRGSVRLIRYTDIFHWCILHFYCNGMGMFFCFNNIWRSPSDRLKFQRVLGEQEEFALLTCIA